MRNRELIIDALMVAGLLCVAVGILLAFGLAPTLIFSGVAMLAMALLLAFGVPRRVKP